MVSVDTLSERQAGAALTTPSVIAVHSAVGQPVEPGLTAERISQTVLPPMQGHVKDQLHPWAASVVCSALVRGRTVMCILIVLTMSKSSFGPK
jgi:hypothetical protein